MIDFIRRNKVFISCLVLCIVVMIGLGGLTIYRKLTGYEPTDTPPMTLTPTQPSKDPQVSLFKGEFDDNKNVLHFVWDYDLHGKSFQHIELYSKDIFVGKFDKVNETDVSISQPYITTGNNEFELRVFYEDGKIVSKKTEVFVDYVFDIEMNHQLVDNNLGKGYLFSVRYHYNASTPVGIPKIFINTTFANGWDAKYIGKKTRTLNDNYQEIEAFYMAYFDSFNDEVETWNVSFNFESVGVRVNKVVNENITGMTFNQENMEIYK